MRLEHCSPTVNTDARAASEARLPPLHYTVTNRTKQNVSYNIPFQPNHK